MGAFDPIDYSSRDFISIRADLIAAIPARLPEWTARSAGDPGILLLEMLAYVGDTLHFYADRIANEAFLATAVRPSSVARHAALIDYTPSPNTAATALLTFTTGTNAGLITIPAGTQVATPSAGGTGSIVFETVSDLTIPNSPGGPGSGTVLAAHGQTVSNEQIGTSNGGAQQDFTLFNPSAIGGTQRVLVEEGNGPVEWTPVLHITDALSTDEVYTATVDDNNITHITFGDGINGRIPTIGAVVSATYRFGGGSVGNVGPATITTFLSPIVGVTGVSNADAAAGGANPESVASIRINAPRSLNAINRAVTTADYAALALSRPGVAKASATAVVDTSVILYVAPVTGNDTQLEAAVTRLADGTPGVQGLVDFFATRKMIGATVTVAPPVFVPVQIEAELHVLPTFSQALVEQNVRTAVGTLFDFTLVDFAKRMTLSAVYHQIQKVPGVDFVVVTMMDRSDGALDAPIDAVMDVDEIPELGSLTLTTSGGV